MLLLIPPAGGYLHHLQVENYGSTSLNSASFIASLATVSNLPPKFLCVLQEFVKMGFLFSLKGPLNAQSTITG